MNFSRSPLTCHPTQVNAPRLNPTAPCDIYILIGAVKILVLTYLLTLTSLYTASKVVDESAVRSVMAVSNQTTTTTITTRQRLWLRLGVNVDDQLRLRLNPIPIPNCNPSANPSPSRNTNTNPNLRKTDPRRPS